MNDLIIELLGQIQDVMNDYNFHKLSILSQEDLASALKHIEAVSRRDELLEFEPIPDPDHCNVYTIKDWLECVDCGGFIDYDGFGNLAYEDKMSNIEVKPSHVKKGRFERVRKDFTHVVWYNR